MGKHLLAVVGNYVYVADRRGGLRVIDISDPAAPREVGSCESLGYASSVAVMDGYAYVVASGGLQVVDISDPTAPTVVGSAEPRGGIGVITEGDYAYVYDVEFSGGVTSDGEKVPGSGGLRVVDISDPAAPHEVHPIRNQTPAIGGPVIAAALKGAHAYLGVGRRLVIADISSPSYPAVLGDTLVLPSHVMAVAMDGDYAYLAHGRAGLRVVDVSDPAAPKAVSSCPTPGIAVDVTVAGDYAYVADREAGLRVVDVSDPSAPHEAASFAEVGTAVDVAVSGEYACVTDRRRSLRVLDVSDPRAPRDVGIYNPPGSPSAIDHERGSLSVKSTVVVGDYAYVLDESTGLWVVQLSNPLLIAAVALAGLVSLALLVLIFLWRAYLSGLRLFLALALALVVPLGPCLRHMRTAPFEVGCCDLPGAPLAMTVVGKYAYVAGAQKTWPGPRPMTQPVACLWVVDISDPTAPIEIGTWETSRKLAFTSDVAVAGNYAYLAAGRQGLLVVDVSDPTAPKEVSRFVAPARTMGVAVADDCAYLVHHRDGLRVVDISGSPNAPVEVGFVDTPATPVGTASTPWP